MTDGSRLYKMKTVTRKTGFSPALLRAWERRHGLLEPQRTEGGHRLYSETDLEVLLGVRALLDEGYTIGEIARRGREALRGLGPAPAPSDDDDAPAPSSIPDEPVTREQLLGTALLAAPRLEAAVAEQDGVDCDDLDDAALADVLERRQETFDAWRALYHGDLPLLRGVKQLADCYQAALSPLDPYEFAGLLPRRHAAAESDLAALARAMRAAGIDADTPATSVDAALAGPLAAGWRALRERPDHALAAHPRLLRAIAVARACCAEEPEADEHDDATAGYEARLLDAVPAADRDAVRQLIAAGRLGWQLLDDHFQLIGRLMQQLLQAIEAADRRLRSAGRLDGPPVGPRSLVAGLRDGEVPAERPDPGRARLPRQLTGRPAAPGLASGPVRRIRQLTDLARLRPGDVLVCDVVLPAIALAIPVAAALVEQRGGMLIHGAIQARDLGIPAVNRVPDALALLRDGEPVTVDGYLGLVTVGPMEGPLEP